jgi:hypothetical protein
VYDLEQAAAFQPAQHPAHVAAVASGPAGKVIVSGTTIYDSNYAALQDIVAECQSPADSYPLSN